MLRIGGMLGNLPESQAIYARIRDALVGFNYFQTADFSEAAVFFARHQ